jgi:hypothetical protein
MEVKMEKQKSFWQKYKDAMVRGLCIWRDTLALWLFIYGIIFAIWFIIAMGTEIFGAY